MGGEGDVPARMKEKVTQVPATALTMGESVIVRAGL